tara:strand:- start:243 stop:446 length:204 start_codon:yes stop_codon:yes gene_type:complete
MIKISIVAGPAISCVSTLESPGDSIIGLLGASSKELTSEPFFDLIEKDEVQGLLFEPGLRQDSEGPI